MRIVLNIFRLIFFFILLQNVLKLPSSFLIFCHFLFSYLFCLLFNADYAFERKLGRSKKISQAMNEEKC
jgi:hypothetical protein